MKIVMTNTEGVTDVVEGVTASNMEMELIKMFIAHNLYSTHEIHSARKYILEMTKCLKLVSRDKSIYYDFRVQE